LFAFVALALCALGAVLVAAVAPAQARACRGADEVGASSAARATLCLLNRERAARGLLTLRAERRLRKAALRHSHAMVRARFFEHVSPAGATTLDRVKRAGYEPSPGGVVGENIAWGLGSGASPRTIVEMWMNSPGHRANILSRRYAEIGVGVAPGNPRDGANGLTYTTDFGR
jgi:uncharacterized protein YkwD